MMTEWDIEDKVLNMSTVHGMCLRNRHRGSPPPRWHQDRTCSCSVPCSSLHSQCSWVVTPTRHCRNNNVWLLWRVIGDIIALALSSPGSLILREVRCSMVGTLKQPDGEVPVVRNWGLLPTTSAILPGGQVSEPPLWWIFQPQSSPHMSTDQANILTATSWETLN